MAPTARTFRASSAIPCQSSKKVTFLKFISKENFEISKLYDNLLEIYLEIYLKFSRKINLKKIAFFELCLLHEFWAEVSVDVTASSSSSCLSMTHHPTPMAHHPNSTNNSQQNAQASPSHPRHPEGTGPDYPIPLVDLDKIHSPRQGKQIRTARSLEQPFNNGFKTGNF